jgi:hypothetical protein
VPQSRDASLSAALLRAASISNSCRKYPRRPEARALDALSLYDAPHPTVLPASRTASHELGHALGLEHYNYRDDSGVRTRFRLQR